MSPDHERRTPDVIDPAPESLPLGDIEKPGDELPDADWLRQHRELVINHFVLRAGGGPSADRKTRRQAQARARRIYRRMVRDAVRQGGKGGG